MKISPLSEGAFTIDTTKVFVPFDVDKDDLQIRPRGSLLVEIQPFLVQTNTDNILIDTGLGFKLENGQPQIFNNLAKLHLQPEDISIVLLSHLHKDHSGGIAFTENEYGKKLSFPKATYYINKDEYLFATTNASSSYVAGAFDILKDNPQVVFTGAAGNIGDSIFYEVTGGHSPHHQVFWIKEKEEIVFFGGDVAPQLQQMKNRFIAKYDFEGRKSMELRKEWWEKGKAENWKFLFYHDIKSPVVRV